MEKKQIVLDFIAAINAHHIQRIYDLMAPDHTFIGTYGDEVHGKEEMKNGWIGYFEWFPDYLIELSDILEREGTFAIFGFAGGSYHGKRQEDDKSYWRLPAAWKAVVEGETIKLWQVFADSKIPCETMNTKDKLRVEQLKQD